MDAMKPQSHMNEGRRLDVEYSRDRTLRMVLALDLAIRRAAHRVLGLDYADASRPERSHATGR
jgi:hypothetical protein